MIVLTLARKPLGTSTIAAVFTTGIGPINIDGSRIGTTKRIPGGIPSVKKNPEIYGTYGERDPDADGNNPYVGRFPSNLFLKAGLVTDQLAKQSGFSASSSEYKRIPGVKPGHVYGTYKEDKEVIYACPGDSGTAVRYFKVFDDSSDPS